MDWDGGWPDRECTLRHPKPVRVEPQASMEYCSVPLVEKAVSRVFGTIKVPRVLVVQLQRNLAHSLQVWGAWGAQPMFATTCSTANSVVGIGRCGICRYGMECE